jgi:PASTA domain
MEPHTLVAVAALDTKNIGWIVGAIVLLFLGSGALVLVSRRTMEGRAQGQVSSSGDKTLIRSWLSVALVAGLLLFAASSFFVEDTDLRSLLMGGVIASTGTATAFYFASKASEETQKNLLDAAFNSPTQFELPDFKGMSVAQARAVAGALKLLFETDPQGAPVGAPVTDTKPSAGSVVKSGDRVTATT